MKVEWAKRPHFAEIAEALNIRTDQVMASFTSETGRTLVLYSLHDDERVFRALLSRDGNGVFEHLLEPAEIPGLWDELRQKMEGDY